MASNRHDISNELLDRNSYREYITVKIRTSDNEFLEEQSSSPQRNNKMINELLWGITFCLFIIILINLGSRSSKKMGVWNFL
jgi:hypothetical protein